MTPPSFHRMVARVLIKRILNGFARPQMNIWLIGITLFASTSSLPAATQETEPLPVAIGLFKKYGDLYDFDWFTVAGQAYANVYKFYVAYALIKNVATEKKPFG